MSTAATSHFFLKIANDSSVPLVFFDFSQSMSKNNWWGATIISLKNLASHINFLVWVKALDYCFKTPMNMYFFETFKPKLNSSCLRMKLTTDGFDTVSVSRSRLVERSLFLVTDGNPKRAHPYVIIKSDYLYLGGFHLQLPFASFQAIANTSL